MLGTPWASRIDTAVSSPVSAPAGLSLPAPPAVGDGSSLHPTAPAASNTPHPSAASQRYWRKRRWLWAGSAADEACDIQFSLSAHGSGALRKERPVAPKVV